MGSEGSEMGLGVIWGLRLLEEVFRGFGFRWGFLQGFWRRGA